VNLGFVRQTNQRWKDLILIEIKRTGVDGSDFLDWPEAQVRGVDLQRAGFLSASDCGTTRCKAYQPRPSLLCSPFAKLINLRS
jgi:hypothetical protein